MKLHELSPSAGSNRETKRIGRGHGSGWGKTAGKGHKGQWARSGGGVRPGFEGGQTTLARRTPKRGFNNHFAIHYAVINLHDLEDRFEAGTEITDEFLKSIGLIKKQPDGVKLLARGEVTKAFNVKLTAVSAAAKAKIIAAGGTVTDIEQTEKTEA
ncbi:MAG: 50S ribosomal protein L15 [Oscillospiraceae bacterium]|jgi:large subunit ribosomal protein L15|nr:50S ribosomal protein L15 [Oscillospiraceae bacterium]